MNRDTQANRAAWNTWLARDLASSHHQDVARFRATGSSLRSIERAEMGAVAGKTLLHLQCNMGSETLSWARLGATVTGVDIADEAIARAEALAAESGLPARFIRADLYDLPDLLDEQFDLVFASYGVLFWLPDLARWADTVAHFLKPGGTFYLVDMHPATNPLGELPSDPPGMRFAVRYPYFHAAEPAQPVDTAPDAPIDAPPDAPPGDGERVFAFGLGEVITALIAAGLRLEYIHEFPMQHYQQFPSLVRDADGWWRWPAPGNTLPMLFSIRASK
jgi:SAM-dependent methyltransferase